VRKVRTHLLEVVLERGAQVRIAVLSGGRSTSHLTHSCKISSGASLAWQNNTLGGSVVQELVVSVEGAHARADVSWVAHAKKNDRQELDARVTYIAPFGSGETKMRAVVEDQATVRSRGVLRIGPKARGTETFLSDHILLLDPTAKADAIPELKIETNDVKAGHAASVSRIHAEDLFYLVSRGLSLRAARNMYVEGFLSGTEDHA